MKVLAVVEVEVDGVEVDAKHHVHQNCYLLN